MRSYQSTSVQGISLRRVINSLTTLFMGREDKDAYLETFNLGKLLGEGILLALVGSSHLSKQHIFSQQGLNPPQKEAFCSLPIMGRVYTIDLLGRRELH